MLDAITYSNIERENRFSGPFNIGVYFLVLQVFAQGWTSLSLSHRCPTRSHPWLQMHAFLRVSWWRGHDALHWAAEDVLREVTSGPEEAALWILWLRRDRLSHGAGCPSVWCARGVRVWRILVWVVHQGSTRARCLRGQKQALRRAKTWPSWIYKSALNESIYVTFSRHMWTIIRYVLTSEMSRYKSTEMSVGAF